VHHPRAIIADTYYFLKKNTADIKEQTDLDKKGGQIHSVLITE